MVSECVHFLFGCNAAFSLSIVNLPSLDDDDDDDEEEEEEDEEEEGNENESGSDLEGSSEQEEMTLGERCDKFMM